MNYSLHDARSEVTRFAEGDSVRAYDYFDAHPEERDGMSGVVFRVWAPNPENVSRHLGVLCRKRQGRTELSVLHRDPCF